MKTQKVGKIELKLFEDIDEMPISVYNLFNEYSLKEHKIGNDMQAINKHFEKLDLFLSKKKIDEAIQERKNLHQTYFNIFNGINFTALQFACFIYSVNGVPINDYSENGLNELISKLSNEGLNIGVIKTVLESTKKKFQIN